MNLLEMKLVVAIVVVVVIAIVMYVAHVSEMICKKPKLVSVNKCVYDDSHIYVDMLYTHDVSMDAALDTLASYMGNTSYIVTSKQSLGNNVKFAIKLFN